MALNRIPKAFRSWIHRAITEATNVLKTSGDQTAEGNKTFSGNIAVGGTLTVTGEVLTGAGVGAVAGSNVTAAEYGNGAVHKTVLTFAARSITMTDEPGTVAYGGSKVYDFPEGSIIIIGAVANLTVAKSGSGINADFDGDFGVGTVTAGNNNALATTEQNIIPTTETPQASSGNTTAKGINTAAVFLDGTATAIDAYLNFLIDDGDQDGGGALLISGTLTLIWINAGDK